jgi:hypothetical protein
MKPERNQLELDSTPTPEAKTRRPRGSSLNTSSSTCRASRATRPGWAAVDACPAARGAGRRTEDLRKIAALGEWKHRIRVALVRTPSPEAAIEQRETAVAPGQPARLTTSHPCGTASLSSAACRAGLTASGVSSTSHGRKAARLALPTASSATRRAPAKTASSVRDSTAERYATTRHRDEPARSTASGTPFEITQAFAQVVVPRIEPPTIATGDQHHRGPARDEELQRRLHGRNSVAHESASARRYAHLCRTSTPRAANPSFHALRGLIIEMRLPRFPKSVVDEGSDFLLTQLGAISAA